MSKSKKDIIDFESKLESIRNKLMENYKEQKILMNEMKDLMTLHKKEIKVASKNVSTNAGKCSGFNKPEKVPYSLKIFLDISDTHMSRSRVTQILYQYFRDNKMLSNKIITPNKKMKKIFNIDKDKQLNFYNLQSWLKTVYDCEATNMEPNKYLIND